MRLDVFGPFLLELFEDRPGGYPLILCYPVIDLFHRFGDLGLPGLHPLGAFRKNMLGLLVADIAEFGVYPCGQLQRRDDLLLILLDMLAHSGKAVHPQQTKPCKAKGKKA